MEPIQVKILSPDASPFVGFVLVAHHAITEAAPASIGDGNMEMEIPLTFYRGNLEMIRADLHNRIDEGIDAIREQYDTSVYNDKKR